MCENIFFAVLLRIVGTICEQLFLYFYLLLHILDVFSISICFIIAWKVVFFHIIFINPIFNVAINLNIWKLIFFRTFWWSFKKTRYMYVDDCFNWIGGNWASDFIRVDFGLQGSFSLFIALQFRFNRYQFEI